MTCACRTATLGIFVRSLAQLSVSGPGASKLAPRRTASSNLSPCLGLRQQRLLPRCFHLSSRQYGQQTAIAEWPEDAGGRPEEHPDPESLAVEDRAVEPPAEVANTSKAGANTTGTKKPRCTLQKPTDDRAKSEASKRTRKPKPTTSKSDEAASQAGSDAATATDAPPQKEDWQIQKEALKEKFPEGWNPRRKLSPDALDGIRALHEQYPDMFTTEALAKRFEVSPEAIRRILKSRWRPSADEEEERQERWFNRGMKVWSRWAELGKKPPRRWRTEGIAWNKPTRRRHEDGGAVRTQSRGKQTRLSGQRRLAQKLV